MKEMYLATQSHHGSARPFKHGLILIDDKGWINGEIPVEDYGMFLLDEKEITESENEIADIFIRLLEVNEICGRLGNWRDISKFDPELFSKIVFPPNGRRAYFTEPNTERLREIYAELS